MANKCELIIDELFIAPGWGCCQCRTYNRLTRTECKACHHQYCGPKFEITEVRVVESAKGPVEIPMKARMA